MFHNPVWISADFGSQLLDCDSDTNQNDEGQSAGEEPAAIAPDLTVVRPAAGLLPQKGDSPPCLCRPLIRFCA